MGTPHQGRYTGRQAGGSELLATRHPDDDHCPMTHSAAAPDSLPVLPGGRAEIRLLVFAASLRADSLNRRLAQAARDAIEKLGGRAELASMHDFDCPSYNKDLEANGFPAAAMALRDRLEANHGFVIASPEYNFSMPGSLKNAIDWVSRFRPQPFHARHGLLMSASPSMVGGNRGLWSLRIPFEHLGARIFPDMFSLARAHQMLDETPLLTDHQLQERFERTIEAFLDLVEADTHYAGQKKAWHAFLGENPHPAIDGEELQP